MPPVVFVDGDTNAIKCFEIERLLNNQTVKKDQDYTVEYLTRWTGYGPEWGRWYNIKDFDNAADFVRDYEEALTQRRH